MDLSLNLSVLGARVKIFLLFPQFTRRTCFTFDNLLPFTLYHITINVANEFTRVDFEGQMFSFNPLITTDPGGKLDRCVCMFYEVADTW
jgi:hypothetical protein